MRNLSPVWGTSCYCASIALLAGWRHSVPSLRTPGLYGRADGPSRRSNEFVPARTVTEGKTVGFGSSPCDLLERRVPHGLAVLASFQHKRSEMIVKNFEYLLALHREGHFGRAANSCNVSQPTLSAGIKQLEEDLDVEIVRHGRRYDGLTPEGERVLAWARKMHNDCNGLERELSALKRGLEGQFRFGVVAGTSVVASILSVALAERIPFLEQSISASQGASLLKALLAHEMDVALTYLEDVSEDDFDTHLLYRERVFLFQASKERLPRRVTWDHVVDMPLCILNSALPNGAQSQLARCSAKTIQTNTVNVLAAHVATGRYATVLPQSLVTYLVQIPHIQAVAVSGEGSHANVGFVAAKGGLKSTTSTALLEIVHAPELVAAIQEALGLHRQFQPDEG